MGRMAIAYTVKSRHNHLRHCPHRHPPPHAHHRRTHPADQQC